MKKIIILIASFLFCQILTAAPIETIKFATEATYPPFEYIDASGKIKGFDIDVANALCKQMNVTCTFTHQSFDSLIPSLNLGKFDALISALGITKERQEQVAFTHSYYEPSGSYVAAKSKQLTLNQLVGKTIGVQVGSTFEKYLKDKFGKQITIKTYASIQDAFLDLASERIDAVLADTAIAQTWLQQNGRYQIVEHPITDSTYFGAGYGIAVQKNNTALLEAFNKALKEIKTNGKYNVIIKQYFHSP